MRQGWRAGFWRQIATDSSPETSETSEGSDGESTAASSEMSAESMVQSTPDGEKSEAVTDSSAPTFAFAFE